MIKELILLFSVFSLNSYASKNTEISINLQDNPLEFNDTVIELINSHQVLFIPHESSEGKYIVQGPEEEIDKIIDELRKGFGNNVIIEETSAETIRKGSQDGGKGWGK